MSSESSLGRKTLNGLRTSTQTPRDWGTRVNTHLYFRYIFQPITAKLALQGRIRRRVPIGPLIVYWIGLLIDVAVSFHSETQARTICLEGLGFRQWAKLRNTARDGDCYFIASSVRTEQLLPHWTDSPMTSLPITKCPFMLHNRPCYHGKTRLSFEAFAQNSWSVLRGTVAQVDHGKLNRLVEWTEKEKPTV